MPQLKWEITGKVFVFEGPDGAGKTTAIEAVSERLQQMGYIPITCRSPGSTELGEYLRTFLKDSKKQAIHKRSEMYLQFANHHQLFHEMIFSRRDHPDYARMIFLIDRLDLSTLVYQSISENDIIQRNSDIRQLQWMLYQQIGSMPTYIILSAAPQVLRSRLQNKQEVADRYESDDEQEKLRIIHAYQDIVNHDKEDRCIHHFINDQSIDEVAFAITETIDEIYEVTHSMEQKEQL